MFFEDLSNLTELVATTTLVYVALVILLRVTGKRTTSEMNSFDWIVTVALGSMVATVSLVDEVPIVEGLAGITTLVLLQYAVTSISARFPRFQTVVKASPRLLYYDGEFDQEALRRERFSTEELMAALRTQGFGSLERVAAIVLETNSDISVLSTDEDQCLLDNVRGWTDRN